MDCYEVWVNPKPGVNDLELSRLLELYLSHLVQRGLMERYRVRVRKLGFGPDDLPNWNITMEFKGMAQMDECFALVATRGGEIEGLHSAVFSRVQDFKAGLWRDFPDSVRI